MYQMIQVFIVTLIVLGGHISQAMTLSQVQSLIDYMWNSDWEEYFSSVINCAELGRWTNQDKMLGLSANLRGPARIFYLSLSQDERADY